MDLVNVRHKLMNVMYVGGEEKHLNNFATLKGT